MAARGKDWCRSVRQKLMKAHVPLWNQLPIEEREHYEGLAVHERSKKVEIVDHELQALYKELDKPRCEQGAVPRRRCLYDLVLAVSPPRRLRILISFAPARRGPVAVSPSCGRLLLKRWVR